MNQSKNDPSPSPAQGMWAAVAEAAAMLAKAPPETFSATVAKGLEGLCAAAGADFSVIWKVLDSNGGREASALFAVPAGARTGQNTASLRLDRLPRWEKRLAGGEPVRSLEDAGEEEGQLLAARNAAQMLLIPIMDQGVLWGLISFERQSVAPALSDGQLAAVTTGSLHIGQALIRNELAIQAAEDRRAAQESLREKSDFFANMSHEIRTPMNVIIGMSAIAKNAGGDLSKINDCLSNIDDAAHNLLDMLNDVLDLSRLEMGRLELARDTFVLEEAVDEAYTLLRDRAGEKGLTVSAVIDEDVPRYLLGDRQRIGQIIFSLLSNAVKFTPRGGRVALGAGAVRQGDRVTLDITVSDTGIGVAPQDREKIFTAFSRTGREGVKAMEGAGLGLATSRALARTMGGDITAEDAPGGGALFTARLTLGLGETPAVTEPGADKEHNFDFSGRTILLAEDIEINRMIVISLLEPTGVRVEQAINGEAALKMFSSYPQHYDLIFMDMHMPVMDGIEATKRIRALPVEHARAVPIIAMTANVFSEDIQRCLDAGMDAHIAKPIDFDRMLHVTEQYIFGRDRGAEQ